jgi:hypothetical protein
MPNITGENHIPDGPIILSLEPGTKFLDADWDFCIMLDHKNMLATMGMSGL